MALYLELIRTFFLIGAFSFGGGLASMEIIRSQVVTNHGWLTNSEFSDIISISEMTPGPLGINIASFVGIRIAGIPGTICSTFAYVTPALIIVLILSYCYYRFRSLKTVQGVLKGLRPAIAAMVVASALTLTRNAFWGTTNGLPLADTNFIAIAVCALMLVCLRRKKLGPVQAILASGVIGAVIYTVTGL